MQPNANLSEKAQKILARFPGPVVLERSILKWVSIIVFTVFLIFIGIFLFWKVLPYQIEKHQPASFLDYISLAPLVLSAGFIVLGGTLGIVFIAIPVLAEWKGRGKLTLERDGFRVWRRTEAFVKWRDVENFRALSWTSPIRRFVFFKEKDPLLTCKNINRWRSAESVNSMLPDTYRFAPQELADLMNAWRERALAEENKTYGSSSVSQ